MPTLQIKVTGKDAEERVRRITEEVNKLGGSVERAGRKSGGFRKAFDDMSAGLTKFKAGVAVVAGALALKQLGSAILDFSRESLRAYADAELQERQLARALLSTANQAGHTAGELKSLADHIQDLAAADGEAVVAAQAVLLEYSTLGRDVFPRALELAADMSAAWGTDLPEAARELGRALENPKKATKLLSASQRDQVEALLKLGRTQEAQLIVLDELTDRVGGAATAAGQSLDGTLRRLDVTTGDLKEAFGEGLSPAIIVVTTHLRAMGQQDAATTFMKDLGILTGIAVAGFATLQGMNIGGLFASASQLRRSVTGAMSIDDLDLQIKEAEQEISKLEARAAKAQARVDSTTSISPVSDREHLARVKADIAEEKAAYSDLHRQRLVMQSEENLAAQELAKKQKDALALAQERAKAELEAANEEARRQEAAAEYESRKKAALSDQKSLLEELGQAAADVRRKVSLAAGDPEELRSIQDSYQEIRLKLLDRIQLVEKERGELKLNRDAVDDIVTAFERLPLVPRPEPLVFMTDKELAVIQRFVDLEQAGVKVTQELIANWDQIPTLLEEAAALREDTLTTEQKNNREILRANKLLDLGLISLEERNRRVAQHADTWRDVGAEVEAVTEQTGDFGEDAQGVLEGVFKDGIRQGRVDWEEGLDDVLDITLDAFWQMLERWLFTEQSMTGITAKEAAKRAVINKASSGSGGGEREGDAAVAAWRAGGGGGSSSSSGMLSGISGATWAALAGAAVVIVGAWYFHKMKKDQGGGSSNTAAQLSGGTSGIDSWSGGRWAERAAGIERSMLGIVQALQESTGVFIRDLGSVRVEVSNNKKKFSAFVDGELVGQFRSQNEAVIAAMREALLRADYAGALDPVIRQVIESSSQRYADPEAFAAAIRSVQQLVDAAHGVDDTERAIRQLTAALAPMSAELRRAGVSADDATELQAAAFANNAAALWDQITGRQQTEAEELADRRRHGALLQAQVALYRTQLEIEVAATEARLRALEAGTQGQLAALDAELEFTNARSALWGEQARQMGAQLNVLSGLGLISREALEQQLAALRQALANLPNIDLADIGPIRGGGRGGRRQEQEALGDEVDQILASGLPQSQQGVIAMADRIADLTARAERFAEEATRVAQAVEVLRQQERRRVQELVSSAVRGPSISGLSESRRQIQQRWEEERAANEAALALTGELTIARWRLNAAEREELARVGEAGMERLTGGDQFLDRLQEISEVTEELTAHAHEYSLTVAEIAAARERAVDQEILTLAEQVAQRAGNEVELMRIAELRYDMQRLTDLAHLAALEAQLELTDDQRVDVGRIRQMLLDMPEDLPVPPPPPDPDGGGRGQVDQWFQQVQERREEEMRQQEELTEAINRLRESVDDVALDEQLSPLTDEQRQQALEQRLQALIAQSQTGTAAERLEAINAIGPLRDQLLRLMQGMLGAGGYGGYVAQLRGWLSPILGGPSPLPTSGDARRNGLASLLGSPDRFASEAAVASVSRSAPAVVVDLRTAALEREFRGLRDDVGRLHEEMRRNRTALVDGQGRLQRAADVTAANTGRLQFTAREVDR